MMYNNDSSTFKNDLAPYIAKMRRDFSNNPVCLWMWLSMIFCTFLVFSWGKESDMTLDISYDSR